MQNTELNKKLEELKLRCKKANLRVTKQTADELRQTEISNLLHKICPVVIEKAEQKTNTSNKKDSKRLIFRYDRKIPDYFSVAGAP